MKDLRFAVIGAGFWSRFQLAGWNAIGGTKCVAIYNRTPTKAEKLAERFDIPAVYNDPAVMLENEDLDFVDVITNVDTHSHFVHLSAQHGLPVVCQKPLAPTLEEAEKMAVTCAQAGVPLLVNENFRWQTPIRQVKKILDSGSIGRVFRARVQYVNSFPVFDNQPSLKQLERFILTDMGTHILDVARYLFGEADSVYCRIERVNPDIEGEDVATVILGMSDGATIICDLSYASRTERERFPETFLFAEGSRGSLELGPDYWIRTTTVDGTHAKRYPPPRYDWADPAYDLVHSSIVPCQKNLLAGLRGTAVPETTAEDNLKTLRLVFAAYESADSESLVRVSWR